MKMRAVFFTILISLAFLETGCHSGSCRIFPTTPSSGDTDSMCSKGMCSHPSHAK